MNFKLPAYVIVALAIISEAYALDNRQKTEMVETHNRFRADVGVSSELSWSDRLEHVAQAYANKLKRERSCRMKHSDTRGLGENLYWASPLRYSNGRTEIQQITARRVATDWGSESKFYDYSRNSCANGEVCGHYTQMVWADTSEIGCARAICDDDSQVWVCNYYPAGNYIGESPY